MADDPYRVLGVAKTATADQIRSAYRKLAKELHPDHNPDDKGAEERFKKVSSAFNLLSDDTMRKRYDRGEIDAEGNERFAGAHQQWGGARAGGGARGGPGPEDLSDLFSDLFGGRRPGGADFAARGRDAQYKLTVTFIEAINGGKKRVTMPDGKSLDLAVPKGLRDGQSLRLRGQGAPGRGGAQAGDAYVEMTVEPHPYFERSGDDIHLEAPVTLKEAVGGAKITIPTVTGPVSVSVPKHSNTGSVLRLKGRGVYSSKTKDYGDQYVKLKVVLPDPADPELDEFVEKWREAQPIDPRKDAFKD